MAEKYVMGLDGGGTKTDVFIFDTAGALISKASGGPTNHEAYDGGFDEMTPVFDGIVYEALGGCGLAPGDIASSVFGMAGIDVPSQKARMEAYVEKLGFAAPMVFNDSFLGIKAACPAGFGISFVNGTGNSVGGIDRAGHWLQVGGTGEAFGDIGGAPGMTREVICAVYSSFYRCGEQTSMADKFLELLGITDKALFTEAIYDQLYTEKVTHRDVHNQVLYAAAAEGDGVALGLLRHFGHEFGRSIAGCALGLDFASESEIEVALIGSASLKAKLPIMLEECSAEAERLTGKHISLIPLAVPPALGAVLWALENACGKPVCADVREKIAAAI